MDKLDQFQITTSILGVIVGWIMLNIEPIMFPQLFFKGFAVSMILISGMLLGGLRKRWELEGGGY